MSGKHEWIDPVSAGRCCSCRFERLLVPAGDIPVSALPDGRVNVPGERMVYVWITRRRRRHFLLDLRSGTYSPNGALRLARSGPWED